jgi:hypothetical protein
MPFFVFIDKCNLWIQNLMCAYIYVLFYSHCYTITIVFSIYTRGMPVTYTLSGGTWSIKGWNHCLSLSTIQTEIWGLVNCGCLMLQQYLSHISLGAVSRFFIFKWTWMQHWWGFPNYQLFLISLLLCDELVVEGLGFHSGFGNWDISILPT